MRSLVKYIRSIADPYLINIKLIIDNLSFPFFDKDKLNKDIDNVNTILENHTKRKDNPHSTKLDMIAHVASSTPNSTSKHVWFNFL